jgi:AraC-like DNA-binding protein
VLHSFHQFLKRTIQTFFLGLISIVITLELLNAWGMEAGYHNSTKPFPFWLLGSYLILPPALLLFAKANMMPKFQLKPWFILLFVPAFIEITVEFYVFYSNKFSDTSFHLMQNTFWFTFTEVLPIMAMAVVLVLYYKNLRSVTIFLKELATKVSFFHIAKLYSFFALFSLITGLWFVQGIIGFQVFNVIALMLSGFVFTLGFIGYFNPSFFAIPAFLNRTTKEEFYQYDDRKELARLAALFENKKIYTRPRLSLDELARELNLPTRYLSGLINSHYHADFRNFVNSYRVNEVIARIQDPKESHKTLLAIALESGFSSKSSFNQIFKTFTGQTPSNYLVK